MNSELPVFNKCKSFQVAAKARAEGWYPFFRPIEKAEGARVIIEGREFLMFGSNNYLGLALDERVRQAAAKAIDEYGSSCSGSRFMNGTLDLHENLEKRLAEWSGFEAALCFTTGYQTNLGAISALAGKGDHVISDKLNHASIMDGIFLSKGFAGNVNLHRYRHNDMKDLEARLQKIPEDEGKLIVTDGVFSMEGDVARLLEMRALADKYKAALYLDEAHSVGVLGKSGRGTAEHFDNKVQPDLTMCTFSKTFGSIGGYVAGPAEVIDYIKHFARPLIFSASMPPANLASVMASLDILEAEPERVLRLQEIARKMIDGFQSLGFDTGVTETPIIPLVTGTPEQTIRFWHALFNRGIYTNPVIPPAVPPNRCLIRTSYMSLHTDDDLDFFLKTAAEEAEKLGLLNGQKG